MMIQDGHVFVSRDIKITPTNHTQHKTTPIRPTHYKMAARTLDTKNNWYRSTSSTYYKMASGPESRDAAVMEAILKEMGVTDYEPNIIHQMMEMSYST